MSNCEDTIHPSRRHVLGAAGVLFAWSFMPKVASAAGSRDPRFVTIVLRGALDGLSAVAPLGDPSYQALRETIALSKSGDLPAIALDDFFALHPAMPNLGKLFARKQALVVHAVATGYRDRSHFDGQDILESGINAVGQTDSGWLNRALNGLPQGSRVNDNGILGVGSVAPLVVRGSAPVIGWAPQILKPITDDLAARTLELYRHTDAGMAKALMAGLELEATSASGMGGGKNLGGEGEAMKNAAKGAVQIMAAPEGPRIAALALQGWDTHANEGGAAGPLARRLAGLDAAIAEFESGLGDAWKDTVIAVITEFGRTVHENGTGGSDHGTATVAFLVGGAVNGGRVVADWPGLRAEDLLDLRDLKPTADLRAVLKGVLADHIGISSAKLSGEIFPGTDAMKPMDGLIL
jgi:uncharacterized protein (DUF1501 family)